MWGWKKTESDCWFFGRDKVETEGCPQAARPLSSGEQRCHRLSPCARRPGPWMPVAALSEVQCIVGLLLGMPVPWPKPTHCMGRRLGPGLGSLEPDPGGCSQTQLAASCGSRNGHRQNRPVPRCGAGARSVGD